MRSCWVDSLELVIEKTVADDPSGRYISAFAEEMPFKNNSFDVGVYSHVLEHVFGPELVLSEAKRIIKPKGKIVVIVPFDFGVDANHLRAYNKNSLVNLISYFFHQVEYFDRIGEGHGCIGIK